MVWPAVIAAGASIAGGVMGMIGANNAASQQAAAAQAQMGMQADLQRELATRNEYLQQLFASNQLQWRAQDARNAGIHPIYAMGAQPMSVSGYAGSISPPGLPENRSHEAWNQMGQNLSRAALSVMDHNERKAALELQLRQVALNEQRQTSEIQLTNAQTDLALSQAARLRGQIGPPFPALGGSSPGGGRSGDVVVGRTGAYEVDPVKVATSQPGNPAVAAGPGGPTVQFNWSTQDALQPFPAPGLKVEDEFMAPLMGRWLMTEVVPMNLGMARRDTLESVKTLIRQRYPNAVGFEWSHFKQGFVPTFRNSSPRTFGDTRHPRQWYSNEERRRNPSIRSVF